MNKFKLLFVAASLFLLPFITAAQASKIPLQCSDTSGSGTAQVCNTSIAMTPVRGDIITYNTTTTNTGDTTLAINGGSAVHIRKWLGLNILAAGDLVANIPVLLIYDGTYWELQVIGNAPTGSLVQGQPLTANATATTGNSSALFLDANQFAGSDPSIKLRAALAACTTANRFCYIDGRSLQAGGASATWTVNPFSALTPGSAQEIDVWLGCYQVITNVQWSHASNDVHVHQCGMHSGSSAVQMSASFPTSTALIAIGDGANLPANSYFSDMRLLVGSGPTSAWVFQGQLLQERSGLHDIEAIGKNQGTTTHDLIVCLGCSHQSFYDLELYQTGANAALTFDGNNAILLAQTRTEDITCNNTGVVQGTYCFHALDTGASGTNYYSTSINRVHAENFTNVAFFDAQSAGSITNADCSANCSVGLLASTTGYLWWANLGGGLSGFTQVNSTTQPVFSFTVTNFNHAMQGSINGNNLISSSTYTTVSKSTDYLATYADEQINVTGITTITFPHALPGPGLSKHWYIVNDGGNTVTLVADSGNMNGAANTTITTNNSAWVTCDGTNCFSH